MTGIYKITNPINEIYIGQSYDIEKRFYQHKNKAINKKLKESFEMYGIENHKFEVILECDASELTKKESEIIVQYRESYTLFNADDYESFAGRKPLYAGRETVLMRVLIRKDKEKEMKSEIKAIQEKYKAV